MDRHITIRIPRFDGRKTLALNGLVLLVAGTCIFGSVLFDKTWIMSENTAHCLAALAVVNILLRLITDRPVRPRVWCAVDPASGPDQTAYWDSAQFEPDDRHAEKAGKHALSFGFGPSQFTASLKAHQSGLTDQLREAMKRADEDEPLTYVDELMRRDEREHDELQKGGA